MLRKAGLHRPCRAGAAPPALALVVRVAAVVSAAIIPRTTSSSSVAAFASSSTFTHVVKGRTRKLAGEEISEGQEKHTVAGDPTGSNTRRD